MLCDEKKIEFTNEKNTMMKTATKPSKLSKPSNHSMTPDVATANINGAFVLKMKTHQWRLCVVKQAPDQSESSWMLFGQHKTKKSKFQLEFKSPYQETLMVRHLVNLVSDDDHDHDDDFYAELRLVLVAESPAISCIESLWPLKGLEMYRTRFHTPNHLHDALHHDVYMLSLSPQISQPHPHQQQPQHPMQTRSKASRH